MPSTFWQFLLPQHLLSRITGKLAHCKIPFLKNRMIVAFISRYKVDMQLALESDPTKYPTFNAFFTRVLKEGVRPVTQAPDAIACPADGSISQCGQIQEGNIFQAKGFSFSLQTLLGGDEQQACPYLNGFFNTIYLSPKDYHRVHMPWSGKLKKMIYIPGKLFSVNQDSVSQIPALFARNERVVALFESEQGDFAVVLIGAMIVASIETVWAGLVAPQRTSHIQTTDYRQSNIFLKKGDEMGQFQLGSTVILLFSNPQVRWDTAIQPNHSVVMGQELGKIQL